MRGKIASRTVRDVLRQHQDGLTVCEIAAILMRDKRLVNQSLRKYMPDAYIDRWTRPARPGPWTPVWCVVTVPEHCPPPQSRELVA